MPVSVIQRPQRFSIRLRLLTSKTRDPTFVRTAAQDTDATRQKHLGIGTRSWCAVGIRTSADAPPHPALRWRGGRMRFPFVSRRRYEAKVRDVERAREVTEAWQAAAFTAWEKLGKMSKKLHALEEKEPTAEEPRKHDAAYLAAIFCVSVAGNPHVNRIESAASRIRDEIRAAEAAKEREVEERVRRETLEVCVGVASREILVREKARRMGANTTPEDFARKVVEFMRSAVLGGEGE